MKVVAVGDVSEQVRGVSYSKSESSEEPRPGYVAVLRANNITDEGLTFDDLVYVPVARVSDKQRIHANDVVIAASSGSLSVVGKAAQARQSVDGSFGAFCKVLRPNGTVDPLYFGHFFRTPFYRRTVSGLAAGANINNLKNEHLDNLQIPLPPLPEQKRIAAILDAADALRAKRRESIEQLDLLIQATFLEMFGDSVKNPKGWESKRIEDFCKTQTGGTPSRSKASRYFGGSIPWVKSGELREQTIYDTEEHITPQALEESAAKMVPKGALMVALYGATVGRIARLGIDAATNQAICSIVPTATHVNPTFMFQALRTKVPEWLSRRVGGGQPNISNGVIKDTLIPLPPLALQTRFASIAESIEQQKTRLKTHLAELDTLFASLQSRAFNGELVA